MLRGGGKYSSSSVTVTSSTPSRGLQPGDDGVDQLLGRRRAGRHADRAGEVVGQLLGAGSPGRPARQPASRASFSRARVLDELAEPITTTASQRGAIAMSADWRLVVAKHRSERPGVHSSGNRSRVAASTPAQSRCDSVVWASRATGSSNVGQRRRRRPPTRPGGWPRAPPPSCRPPPRGPRGRRRRCGSPCRPAPCTSWWTLVTSGHTASTT